MPPAKKTTRRATTTSTKRARTSSVAKKSARVAGKRAPAKKLSAAHKRALAAGRTEAHHVRAYLDALADHKPRRGRQRTAVTVRKQLAAAEDELRTATGYRKLELAARRIELRAELDTKTARGDLSALRKNFVGHAGKYASAKGSPSRRSETRACPQPMFGPQGSSS
jgi:hypothetical protein